MKNAIRLRDSYFAFLIIIYLLPMNAAHALGCDFLPPAPAPDWINNDPAIAGYYVGVGVSGRVEDSFDKQKLASREAALADLSSNIEVSIRYSFSQQKNVSRSGGDEDVNEDIAAITKVASNITLRNVELESIWLNRHSCMLWTRVKIKKSIVDEIQNRNLQRQRVAELENHLHKARENQRPLADKQRHLKLATIMLGEINFVALKGSKGRDYFQSQLNDIEKALQQQGKLKQTAETLFKQASQLLQKARTATSRKQASESTRQAVLKLNRILADFSWNNRDDWVEQAAMRLGNIERNKANDCAAQQYYQRIQANTLHASWKQKATELGIGLLCDKKKMAEYKWRRSFDGQKVLLVCAYSLGEGVEYWSDLCDRVRTRVSRYGAIVEETDMDDQSLLNVVKRQQRSSALKKITGYAKILVVTARGDIATRKSKKKAGTEEYQFKGKIGSFMLSDTRLEFSDNYSGAGGWNPISKTMAMEVLGVHVDRRLAKKLASSQ